MEAPTPFSKIYPRGQLDLQAGARASPTSPNGARPRAHYARAPRSAPAAPRAQALPGQPGPTHARAHNACAHSLPGRTPQRHQQQPLAAPGSSTIEKPPGPGSSWPAASEAATPAAQDPGHPGRRQLALPPQRWKGEPGRTPAGQMDKMNTQRTRAPAKDGQQQGPGSCPGGRAGRADCVDCAGSFTLFYFSFRRRLFPAYTYTTGQKKYAPKPPELCVIWCVNLLKC